jgi:bifunctional non-homologous end joining protein LigD
MSIQAVNLSYRDAGSDKVYHVQIEEVPDGFVVNFQYGRRGSTLQTGTKTASPVDLNKAESIFSKLVSEKKAKGYGLGDSGTPYAGTEQAGKVSGLVPQLLNPIEEDRLEQLLDDDDWMLQEKKDGIRLMNRVNPGVVTTSNRKGLIVPANGLIEARLKEPPLKNYVVDGEGMGDVLWMFDLIEADGRSLREDGAYSRWLNLSAHFGNYDKDYSAIRIVPAYVGAKEKRAALIRLRAERAEGVVFKRMDSPYVSGRPNSGGYQVIFKFHESCTCFVRAINDGKRSIVLGMKQLSSDYVGVGNCTIPANFKIPKEGDLVEVRYLYAFPGGSLYQPVYWGPRTDLPHADDISVLKFKQGTTDDEEV